MAKQKEELETKCGEVMSKFDEFKSFLKNKKKKKEENIYAKLIEETKYNNILSNFPS